MEEEGEEGIGMEEETVLYVNVQVTLQQNARHNIVKVVENGAMGRTSAYQGRLML